MRANNEMRALVFFFVLLTCPRIGSCQPQSPAALAPQLKARGINQESDRTLLLDAVLLDGKGLPIPDLQQADFVLMDDKRKVPQSQWSLVESGTPVSQAPQVLLVIDSINSSLSDVSRIEESIRQYLQKGSGPLALRTTILFVGDTRPEHSDQSLDKATTMALESKQLYVHRTPTSTDRNALLRSFGDYKTGMSRLSDAQGADINSDRVRLSLQALSYVATAYTSIKGPKLLVWLGPGWPFLKQSAAKSSEALFDSIIYFNDLLQRAQITLYSVSPVGVTAGDSSAQVESFELAQRASSNRSLSISLPPNVPVELTDAYYAAFLNGVRNIGQSNPNDLDLQVLAYHTGGLILQKNNDLTSLIERCVADAFGMYVFTYKPSRTQRLDTYHDLEIKYKKGSQPARTLTGFYAR